MVRHDQAGDSGGRQLQASSKLLVLQRMRLRSPRGCSPGDAELLEPTPPVGTEQGRLPCPPMLVRLHPRNIPPCPIPRTLIRRHLGRLRRDDGAGRVLPCHGRLGLELPRQHRMLRQAASRLMRPKLAAAAAH